MIEYLSGPLTELTPATAVIECGGVGYLANISLNTFSALQGKTAPRLYIHEALREDAHVLWGFATKEERSLFMQLISVSGIGGNTARTILSAFSPAELCDVIMNGNDKILRTVKGLGLKTAQRIIVELKDKVPALGIMPVSADRTEAAQPAVNQQVHDDAIEALKALGYPPAPVTKAVRAILTDQPDATVQHVIRMALKML